MHDEFLSYNSWFQQKYATPLSAGPRFDTLKIALNLFRQRHGRLIVETGCQRQLDDWGGGCSTQVFADSLAHYGGKLVSIDISPENIATARQINPSPYIDFICNDSVNGLSSLSTFDQIDLLYLDSFDYPYGQLLDLYGGKTDIVRAIDQLKQLNETTIVQLHNSIIEPCQQHCLKEIQTAMPFLHSGSVILIDDNNLPGGGKARLANEYLETHGWVLVHCSYQALWIHQ